MGVKRFGNARLSKVSEASNTLEIVGLFRECLLCEILGILRCLEVLNSSGSVFVCLFVSLAVLRTLEIVEMSEVLGFLEIVKYMEALDIVCIVWKCLNFLEVLKTRRDASGVRFFFFLHGRFTHVGRFVVLEVLTTFEMLDLC